MTDIAHGTIKIDLDDQAALAGLKAINGEFERTMADINREKATAVVDLNIDPLKDNLANARRELKKLEAAKANPEVSLSKAAKKNLDKQIREIRAEIKMLDGLKADIEIKLKGTENADKAFKRVAKLAEKQALAEERYIAKIRRLEEQAEARRIAGVKNSTKVISSLRAQREREELAAHTEALRMNAELNRARERAEKEQQDRVKQTTKVMTALSKQREREESARQQELDDVPRLQREYVELAQKIERLAGARRRAYGDPRQTQVIDFNLAEAEIKMRALHSRLEAIGSPVDVDINIHPGRRFGTELRMALQNRAITGSAEEAGIIIGARLLTGFQHQVQQKFSKTAALAFGARTFGRIGDIFSNLSKATVRLGPFTATLRQLGLVMAVLGPTILDLVGAFGSLISVAGAGLLGAATVGAGAVVGLGAGFLGLKFSMRNTSQEVGNARSAIDALQKAQEKYGDKSDKAKAKQKELNNTLKHISPLARETALGIEDFYSRWDKGTVETQGNLGRMAKVAFSALDDITPRWASRTNQLSGILLKATRGVANYVKGRGGSVLDAIMGDFNKSLPDLLGGVGRLGESFLNLGRAGARFLPEVGRSFKSLAQRALDFTRSDKFGETVSKWVDSARNIGRFFGAAARVLTHFFGTGVEAGNRFVNTMTAALNRWDKFITSDAGQKRFGDFFQQSVSGAEALWHALAPIGVAFTTWASNLSPVVTGFLKGAGAITGFVGQLVKLVGLQGSIGTLAATLGALWAIGKVGAATRAIIGFTQALLGMQAAERGLAATTAASRGVAATSALPMLIPGSPLMKGVTTAAPALTRTAAASAAAGRGLTFLGSAAGFANPYVGAAVLGAGALYVAYKLLTRSENSLKEQFKDAGVNAGKAAESYRTTTSSIADLGSAHERAEVAVRDAEKALKSAKKGTDEYRLRQLDLKDAQRQLITLDDEWTRANKSRKKAAEDQVKSAQEQLAAYDKLADGQRKGLEYDAKSATSSARKAAAIEKLNALERNRGPLVDRVNAALNRQAAASINTQRAAHQMVPVLAQAEQKLGALARLSRTSAVKIALKFEAPKDVGRVAASASASLKAGVPARIVTRIVADSRNADEAVRRLKAARIDDKKFDVVAKGGTGAVKTLEDIAGRKLTNKEFSAVMKGGDTALKVLAKILGIKLGTKTQRIQETGSATVAGALQSILGLGRQIERPVSAKVTANTSAAFGPLDGVIARLGRIQSKTVTVTVRAAGAVPGLGNAIKTKAKGGAAENRRNMAVVGEGNNWRGASEIIANQRTGQTTIVDKPTLMALSPDDYVIPTEARYRDRGESLFRMWAKGLGIPMYRKSRKPSVPKINRGNDPEKLAQVQNYKNLQQTETDIQNEISLAERKVKEPSSLIKVTGVDPVTGNVLYGLDQPAIDTYTAQLNSVRLAQEKMVGKDGNGGLMTQMVQQAQRAYAELAAYRDTRRANIATLQAAIDNEARYLSSKDDDTKKAAKARVDKDKDLIESERGLITDANTVTKDVQDDQHDLTTNRRPNYRLDWADTKSLISGVAADAASQVSAANPAPPEPVIPPAPGTPGGPTLNEDKIGRLETERSLAAIGMGINGAPPRAMYDILKDLLGAENEQINVGTALLNDSIRGNDSEGYAIIQAAAGAIASLNDDIKALLNPPNDTDSGSGTTPPVGIIAQQTALSTAMVELFRSMGSNIRSSASGTAAVTGAGATTLGTQAPKGSSGGTPSKNINIIQNFPTQPDPLTWASSTRYEIAAAV